jgi:acyl-CoA dehydrogenase
MDLGMSERVRPMVEAMRRFIQDEVMPVEAEYQAEIGRTGDRWQPTDRMRKIVADLQKSARSKGLWNLFLTDKEHGAGLTTVEYAYLAEEMGWSPLAPIATNCAAPDSGNMEALLRYGSQEQQERWLKPLLDGEIRSSFVMTEPDVASSDATNIRMPAVLDGDEWVLNGEKHFSSGIGDPNCKIMIVMVKTNPDAERHQQHSQILVPTDTPGVEILRPMTIFGHDGAPHGHMHLRFTNVRVPKDNIIWEPGRGFEIAQGRLGPGRIHHAMRAIGQAERALKLMCERSLDRVAFGKPLAQLGANHDIIAESRMAIEMARLLCLKAAWMIDTGSVREAQLYISMIKVIAPRVAIETVDEAIQIHGAAGLSQDFPLAEMYMSARTLRLADGPDAVHRRQIARAELKKYKN